MDTKKDCRIPKCGDLAELTGKQVVVGAKQLRKAFRDGRVVRVYLAENADPAITAPIEERCKENMVSYTWIATMSELGRACSSDVGAAAAATLPEI